MKHVCSAVLLASCLVLGACGGQAEKPADNDPLPPLADEPLEELPPAENIDEAPIHSPNEGEPR